MAYHGTSAERKGPKMSKTGIKQSTANIVNFLDELRQPGVPARSLQDHILLVGKPQSYPEFISMRTGAQARLRVGGSHHALLGTVVFPSPYKRGKAPKWCGNTPSMENKVDLDAKGRINANRWMNAPAVLSSTTAIARITKRDLSVVTADPRFQKLSKTGKAAFENAFSLINEILEVTEDKVNKLAVAEATISEMKANFHQEMNERLEERLLEFRTSFIAEMDSTRAEVASAH
jgi:hypothetical protein